MIKNRKIFNFRWLRI